MKTKFTNCSPFWHFCNRSGEAETGITESRPEAILNDLRRPNNVQSLTMGMLLPVNNAVKYAWGYHDGLSATHVLGVPLPMMAAYGALVRLVMRVTEQ